ncbi:Oidioi.mRNA.OKI2018_I69.chr1.g803.t1.cds [Oikopleura dioica]|uniref:Oidioi.mRNA.OKI2018_I69.chr1.g803.t1.cds n=1 Tax=Oikopleura dioica TaxID=34765 RepID=A0ABN7SKZ2_OIKDI|nr:Oidioi.mRNA.OKI2018_I69.chr1.g803.t1.cds [Oikopleura dioica]
MKDENPLIVVTDPNELIVMKQKENVFDPGHAWSKQNFCEFPTLGKIQLRVIQGTDLMDTDLIGKSDPYCIVLCGPNKFETKRVPNDLNPKWSEKFDFDWHGEEFLQIECWDFNKLTHDDFLGSVEISIQNLLSKNSSLSDSGLRGFKKGQFKLTGKDVKHGKLDLEIIVEMNKPEVKQFSRQFSVKEDTL